MGDDRLPLGRESADRIAALLREARILVGWSQRELAARAGTSQSMISRLERGAGPVVDVLVLEKTLSALGIRASLDVDARHLRDRRRQADAVHARLNGMLARRLERLGWRTATEVPIGVGSPRGWIDLLAFRPADRSLLVDETKTEIGDLGGLQRSLSFYEQEAWASARRLGWRPARSAVLCVVLDSRAIAERLVENRELVARAFTGDVPSTLAWLAEPGHPVPRGWTLATADPVARGSTWLRPTTIGSRRKPPAYAHYAEAAARLRRTR